MKKNQRILQIHSLLSRLMDSLCFQMSVNVPDANSESLLEIIEWRKKGEITQEQLKLLYVNWLQSKNIFDLLTAKQVETYPKNQLLARHSSLGIHEITSSLEIINELYNTLYLERRQAQNEKDLLQKTQQIFSYLDNEGVIHLRLSETFFLVGALLIIDNYSIPINYQAFRVHLKDYLKGFCSINGLVSLRCFKNYLLRHPQRLRIIAMLLPTFKDLAKAAAQQGFNSKSSGQLPNILQQAFIKWREYPRFKSSQQKKKIEIYRRVFEEDQEIFFFEQEEGRQLGETYFLGKYGDDFLRCFQINNALLLEFGQIVQEVLNGLVTVLQKVSNTKPYKAASFTARNKLQPQSQQIKLHTKNTAKQNRTPKHNKAPHVPRSRTPTHKPGSPYSKNEFYGSAEKYTPRKHRQVTPSKKAKPFLLPNSGHKPIPNYRNSIKQGLDGNSLYQKLFFFRNKRVESYDIVIKRLKQK